MQQIQLVQLQIIHTNAVLNIYRTTWILDLLNSQCVNRWKGHTNGTYYNIKLFNNNAVPSNAVWDGATADVTVSGGSVTAVNIVQGGSGYTNGETIIL